MANSANDNRTPLAHEDDTRDSLLSLQSSVLTARHAPRRVARSRRHGRLHTKGQALLIVALVMVTLLLFLGLGVDVGNMMGKKAKLQSAVDAAALSAAQVLFSNTTVTQTATNIAYQIIETNGVPSTTLSTRLVEFPGEHQIRVTAVQTVSTYFMRLIPLWATVRIRAQATADLSSYAEITTKPYGLPGVVNELNLMVWGADSWRRGGDAFSPVHGIGPLGGSSAATPNPEFSAQPYGYLYRVDVPPFYPYDDIRVEIFDPDSFNKTGTPAPWPTVNPTGTPSPTAVPSADQYASCGNNTSSGTCTSNGQNYDTGMKLGAFTNGRPAFWRVDELRTPYTTTFGNQYNSGYATTTQYTLWHFSPHITSAFADPATLSDLSGSAYIARYTSGWNSATDLSWVTPSGFTISLYDASGHDRYQRELNGSVYFYIYIKGTAGSSENNFDLRVGPTSLNSTHTCTTPCYVNQEYLNNVTNPASYPDWNDGGAKIFAKQSLPLNLVTGDAFPLAFTQVSKNAGGQVLGVRHFDQDCNVACGTAMHYQMQVCGCNNLNDPACWQDIGIGYVGPNDGWAAPADASHPSGYLDPEPVYLPPEGSALYTTFFGATGQCATSWLRIQSNPSYTGDSTTWQMPYIRPRLIK